jgi:ATP adenylyltransferase
MMSSMSCEEKYLDEQNRTAPCSQNALERHSAFQRAIESKNCTLCEILQDTEENETFIARLEYGSLFLHWNQCYTGRCLYISNVHIENYPNIDYDLFVNLNRELLLLCKMIKRTFQPDLINYASLRNEIKHFHYHIIPRYEDDPNWGGPPWPSLEKKLTRNEYRELANVIHMSLGECEWWTR